MLEVLRQSIMITGFVFVMMLVIEYFNVITSGVWRSKIVANRWGEYLLGASLGAIPGCLGAFAAVAMYAHRLLSLGAIVSTMVATSGDESFVLLAMVPGKALIIFAALFVIGLFSGAAVDGLLGRRFTKVGVCPDGFEVHKEFVCECFDRSLIKKQWHNPSPIRGILTVVLGLGALAVATGQVGPGEWSWVRITLIIATGVALFIVSTVPEHFLEEHLWRHIAMKHVPRIFLWTFSALLAVYILVEFVHVDIDSAVRRGRWIVLVIASLVGIIPESGPHLIFVTLFARGSLPVSVLLANSIVQDGHGMLPLLAHSGKAFVIIKLINFIIGLSIGAIVMAVGY